MRYEFERVWRTPHSEGFRVSSDGQASGRVDLHFAPSSIVYATLCVPADFGEEAIEDLIGEVDERLVLTTDPYRDDFVVAVWAGRDAGFYTEEFDEDDEFDDDLLEEEDDEPDSGDGRAPVA